MEFQRIFCVFQIVSYQLNYIYKGPQTHRGVCLDHLEPFRISFQTFEKFHVGETSSAVIAKKEPRVCRGKQKLKKRQKRLETVVTEEVKEVIDESRIGDERTV